MDYYSIATILIVLSALFGYLNIKFLKLPTTIGLMLISIIFTFGAVILGYFNDILLIKEREFVAQIDFTHILLDVMLSFLLFAGALHTNFFQLKVQRWPIFIFSTLGTLVSTFLVGISMYWLLPLFNLPVDLVYCLLFGALISPTDPIAVLGILKKVGIPKKLEAKIIGESLFNDGVGVVLFITILQVAQSDVATVQAIDIVKLFGEEVVGGIGLGAVLGWITSKLLKSINNYDVEITITLAAVMGGTLVAQYFHMSAPLAMVTAGLIVGNSSKKQNNLADKYVDKFWELVDVLLNTILFVMIGMELLVLTFKIDYVFAGLATIPLVLFIRYISLFIPITLLKKRLKFVPNTNSIMTWGGLRGGLSIALALSLTSEMHRELFLVITYTIVVFSIIIQGLTVGPLVKYLNSTSKN